MTVYLVFSGGVVDGLSLKWRHETVPDLIAFETRQPGSAKLYQYTLKSIDVDPVTGRKTYTFDSGGYPPNLMPQPRPSIQGDDGILE